MGGRFTLPGEAGFEALTLALAKAWGADVIRDSDGTKLSSTLLDAGYTVYSTLCLIRSVNGWAKENQDKLQQNLLMSEPVLAQGDTVLIGLLDGYSKDQFRVNDGDGMEFWQVFDRTAGREVPREDWSYREERVTVRNAVPYHHFTVNFFAFRLWEAISMYNHMTNGWGDRERLMPVEPWHPEARAEILAWLRAWCQDHPQTDVVRFTSMFYNFAWIWSDDPAARDVYSDWGSYDFTVNPLSLRAFRAETGIGMTSEDFIRGGLRNPTHTAPTEKMRRWMAFAHAFVAAFGQECVEVAHSFGKKAYVFYDDSWIGVEPYGPRFSDFGFDGIIKCVFGGYETRLCAAVPHVKTREIRLHPYLFPTGLKGEPTFAPGGTPERDLWRYWLQVRRALLRAPVERIGLGGYLHLVEPFPAFVSAVGEIADAFRALVAVHAKGAPKALPKKLAVLTAWGSLRTWSTSGHLHEHPEIDLTHALEAVAGLPVEVVFLSFDDVREKGIPEDVGVILSAGWPGSAWSGGSDWQDAGITALLTQWVHGGGGLIGIREPSGTQVGFALSHLFGVNRDYGGRKCLRMYPVEANPDAFICVDGVEGLMPLEGVFIETKATRVLAEEDGMPLIATNEAGKGRAVYLSGYRYTARSARMLLRAFAYAGHMEADLGALMTNNPMVDMAVYPGALVLVNNTAEPQGALLPGRKEAIWLEPCAQRVLDWD